MSGRQRPLVIGVALLLAALSGCGTGQVTQTARQHSGVNGANGQAGPIAVRDAEFPWPEGEQHSYPQGSSVPLKLTIVNTGDAPDRLAAVQTPVAGSVRVTGRTVIPERSALHAVVHPATEPHEEQATTTTPAPTTTAPAPTTTTPPGTTTPPATTTPGATTTVQPTTAQPTTSPTELDVDEVSIVLLDITEEIRPGRTVRVVLLFEQAGEVVLEVPIAVPGEPRGEAEH